MIRTIGNIDLTDVIVKAYDSRIYNQDEKIGAPVECNPDYYEKAQKERNALYDELCGKGEETATLIFKYEDVLGALNSCREEHFYSAGFMDGMRYAAYVLSLATGLQSSQAIKAGLQLAEVPD